MQVSIGGGGGYLAAILCGAALCLLTASAGWAQGLSNTGQISDRFKKAAPEKPSEPLAAAIPGARSRGQAAPATRPVGDMQPTEALFDAINRGDIAGARDALNRGADLNGVNILGMTPMELSVDLGRNDISFLLLSMRGEDSGRGSRAVSHEPAGGSAVRAVQAKPPQAPRRVAAPADAPVAQGKLATPKLFANDGGSPLPNAGFLGFDSRSAAN